MINQISPSSVNSSVFKPLQDSGLPYAVIKSSTDSQKVKDEKEQNERGHNLGVKIAGVTLLTALGAFAVIKGAPKNWRFKVDKFFNYIEGKSSKLKNKGQANLSTPQVLYLNTLKFIKSLTIKSKTIFNTAPLKDALVMKMMKKSPFFERLGNKITDIFERISVRTSKRYYSKTLVKFDEMYSTFAIVNQKLPKDKAKLIEQKIERIKTTYDEAFSETARNNRLEKIKTGLNGIDEKVWKATYGDFKHFLTSKKTYQTFISEELAALTKSRTNNEVSAYKAIITNDVNDNYHATMRIMNNLDSFVDPTDPESRVLIQKIRKNLTGYKKSVEKGKKEKSFILDKDFSNTLNDLKNYIVKSDKYDIDVKSEVAISIDNLSKILKSNKKGEVQEILDIYKEILPSKDYEKLKKQTYTSLSSLNKATDVETDKLFDKVRDLKIGAAPTDVVGVLASVGVVGWGLSKAENKDEVASVALKYGIPTIGGIMISLYCTVGLFSGGAALGIGLASGLIMNQLGGWADKLRKKLKGKTLNFNNLIVSKSETINKVEQKLKSSLSSSSKSSSRDSNN